MRRLLWSALASVILNAAAWTWSGHLWFARDEAPQARERVAVSVSSVRIERRRPLAKPAPAPTPAPMPTLRTPTPIVASRTVAVHVPKRVPTRPRAREQYTPMLAPPPPASLSLPQGWSRQDFGFLGTTKAAEWLDWKNQSAKWVPRVFVWRIDAQPEYMSRPSLQNAIAQVLSTLHDERVKLYASKAQSVCNGQRPGWFLSYVKMEDDPPLHLEETLFMDGTTIYRATYIRSAEQQEDPKARAALNTLCV